MKDLLEIYGYKFYSKCSCDGHASEKYKNGTYRFYYRPKQQRFRIRNHGSWVMQWMPIKELENKLNELHPENIKTVQA
jgi:hypothetical protein